MNTLAQVRPKTWVALRNHTHKTPDAISSIDGLITKAVACGMESLAITDDNLAGAYTFHHACKEAGIKPIIGLTAHLAMMDETRVERSRFDPKKNGEKTSQKITLWARNNTGWENLLAILNEAQQNSFFYGKPLVDYQLLRCFNDGLIIGTGPVTDSPITDLLREGKTSQAADELDQLVSIGDTFVEIDWHGTEQTILDQLARLADTKNLPLLATLGSHYLNPENQAAHEAWLCIKHRRHIEDPDRPRLPGNLWHLSSEQETRTHYAALPYGQQAVDNTATLANLCDDTILTPPGAPRIPQYRLEWLQWKPATAITPDPTITIDKDGVWQFNTSQEALYTMVRDGAVARYGTPFTTELKQRLRHELDTIGALGFTDYFLAVYDLVRWAQSDKGIPSRDYPHGQDGQKKPILVGPGRGSAPGSAVAYCLGITRIDPLACGLDFSRFLDPSRADLPDIDIDVEASRREEVLRYLEARWGTNQVALLGTSNMVWAKTAVRDMARVTGRTPLADQTCTAMNITGTAEETSITTMMHPDNTDNRALQQLAATRQDVNQLLLDATLIEGASRGDSIHACGVVLADQPLDTTIPLRWASTDTGQHWVTAWEGDSLARWGLVKFDVLASKTLDIISHCLTSIAHDTGEILDFDHITTGGERGQKTWSLIQQGRTSNVFQMSSQGMRDLCQAAQVSSMDELMAVLALYRPGPMAAGMGQVYARRNSGQEPVNYDYLTTFEAEQRTIGSVLDVTRGTLCYQEQLMGLGRKIAGFDDVQVNLLRRAFSKKDASGMASLRQAWNSGGVAAGFNPSTLDGLWSMFEGSARYLFNASHSAAYARIAFVTAWLKANFPAQFGAAVLSVTPRQDVEKRRRAINDLEADGVAVFPPDINLSEVATCAVEGGVRFGLGEIRDVGSVAAHVVAERDANGAFSSLEDVLSRVKLPAVEGSLVLSRKFPVTVAERLIEAGALDEFGPRLGLMMVVRAPGMPVPDMEFGPVERSARQRQLLNVAFGGSVLADPSVAAQLGQWRDARGTAPVGVGQIPCRADASVVFAGVVAWVQQRTTRTGPMLFVGVEGSVGCVEVKVFPKTFASLGCRVPLVGEIVGVSGRTLVGDDGRVSVAAFSLWRGGLVDEPRGMPVVAVQHTPTPAEPVKQQPAVVGDFVLRVRRGASWATALRDRQVRAGLRDRFAGVDRWVTRNCGKPGATHMFESGGVRLTVEIVEVVEGDGGVEMLKGIVAGCSGVE